MSKKITVDSEKLAKQLANEIKEVERWNFINTTYVVMATEKLQVQITVTNDPDDFMGTEPDLLCINRG